MIRIFRKFGLRPIKSVCKNAQPLGIFRAEIWGLGTSSPTSKASGGCPEALLATIVLAVTRGLIMARPRIEERPLFC